MASSMSTENPQLSINLVCFNEKDLLRNALRYIKKAQISIPYEVVVLDNSSQDQDEVMDMVSVEYPEAIRLAEKTNTGFTQAVNTCARHSKGTYLFNMNPDVVVLPGQLEQMVAFLKERPNVGMMGPKLLNFDGTVQGSAFQFTTPQIALYRRTPLGRSAFAKRRIQEFLLQDGWDWNSERKVDWVLGAAVMYRRSVAEELGHLDENLFLYFSDTDFAWRLWENGYMVVYYPEAMLYHYYQKSSGGTLSLSSLFNFAFRKHLQDGVTFFRKHLGDPNPRLQKMAALK
ncbi:MAG: hypothetical protein BRC23_00150 [Parcubacteria group bacterium SW_4_49_11]|nr:MAG: hypothetical protein BRC23_00150 [Parcubacteria group bacterium SW_4_49_11]